jgi:hypothetical protein
MAAASCSLRYGSIEPGNQTEVKGSGVVVREEHPVSGFDKILLEGTAKMEIRLGDSESLRLEGEDNILPLITSEVKRNRLVIGVRPGYNLNITEPVWVWITMKALQGVQIDGAGLINAAGSVERLGVKVSGAGSMSYYGEPPDVSKEVNGAGTVNRKGTK